MRQDEPEKPPFYCNQANRKPFNGPEFRDTTLTLDTTQCQNHTAFVVQSNKNTIKIVKIHSQVAITTKQSE